MARPGNVDDDMVEVVLAEKDVDERAPFGEIKAFRSRQTGA